MRPVPPSIEPTSSRNDRLSSLAALVVAGGQSSRMGKDKAKLEWKGVPLLTHICCVAQQMTADVTVLSPWPEQYQAILDQEVHLMRESSPGRGPLWALHEGLQHCAADWILLLACDMPYLNSGCLQRWRSQLEHLPNSCLAYVPQTDMAGRPRWEPLCGFYRRSSLTHLTRFLKQGGLSFQAWLAEIDAIAIPLLAQDLRMLTNCNTPEDWSAVQSQPSPFSSETS